MSQLRTGKARGANSQARQLQTCRHHSREEGTTGLRHQAEARITPYSLPEKARRSSEGRRGQPSKTMKEGTTWADINGGRRDSRTQPRQVQPLTTKGKHCPNEVHVRRHDPSRDIGGSYDRPLLYAAGTVLFIVIGTCELCDVEKA